jgi:glycosyltransferase involved in cell wall biosynthesis
MKIALYYPWIYTYGGIERSMLELLSRSRHEWDVYTGHYEPGNTFPELQRFKIKTLKELSVNRSIGAVFQVAVQIISQKIPLTGYDAFVVWCDGMGDFAVFRNHRLPTFNICSTPLRAAFDPVYQRQVLAARRGLSRAALYIFRFLFRMTDKMAWRHYDGVISTSAEVKDRIIKGGLYQDGPGMQMCYPGIDWSALDGEVSYEPLLLVAGRITWTKNIELAISAFQKSGLPEPWQLVIAGFVDRKSETYLQKLENLAGDTGRINFIVAPSDAELRNLYRRASAILFPPLNEDWGIVPLEAMATRKPVMANNSGGPRESIVDGKTGWLLPPDAESWSCALKSLPENRDMLKKMGDQAREHSRLYDWSQFVYGIDNAMARWVEASGKKHQ